jgi:aminopeptidase N
LFDNQSYIRGAMTLQALRNEVGDEDFFDIAREWAQGDGNGTTEEFMALAEQISGEQLDDLFDVWLFTAQKPPASAITAAQAQAARPATEQARAASRDWLDDVQRRLRIGRY